MAEAANNPTATAAGGFTIDQVNAAVSTTLNAALSAAMKPLTDAITQIRTDQGILADTLKALPPATAKPTATQADPATPATTAGAGTSLTLEAVTKLLDDKLKSQQQESTLSQQRSNFAKDKLGKLPGIYADQLGNDPTKWDAEATAIQQRYEADLKAQGFKPANVTPAATGAAGTPANALPVALDKMTDSQVKDAAIKALPPIPGAAQPAAADAAAAATT